MTESAYTVRDLEWLRRDLEKLQQKGSYSMMNNSQFFKSYVLQTVCCKRVANVLQTRYKPVTNDPILTIFHYSVWTR